MADLSRKAMNQVQRFVRTLLQDCIPKQKVKPENIENIVKALTTGQVTHDYPITVEEATEMGLPVTAGSAPNCLRPDGAVPATARWKTFSAVHPNAL